MYIGKSFGSEDGDGMGGVWPENSVKKNKKKERGREKKGEKGRKEEEKMGGAEVQPPLLPHGHQI